MVMTTKTRMIPLPGSSGLETAYPRRLVIRRPSAVPKKVTNMVTR